MTLAGAASPIIEPKVSILAGCSRSVDFAKIVMQRPISSVVRRVDTVRTTTFVDDVAQSAIGTLQQVADRLSHAGVAFANSMTKLKLRISTKSIIVASRCLSMLFVDIRVVLTRSLSRWAT